MLITSVAAVERWRVMKTIFSRLTSYAILSSEFVTHNTCCVRPTVFTAVNIFIDFFYDRAPLDHEDLNNTWLRCFFSHPSVRIFFFLQQLCYSNYYMLIYIFFSLSFIFHKYSISFSLFFILLQCVVPGGVSLPSLSSVLY